MIYTGIIGGCSFTGFAMGIRESYLNHRSSHVLETQVHHALHNPFRGAGHGFLIGTVSPLLVANGVLDAMANYIK